MTCEILPDPLVLKALIQWEARLPHMAWTIQATSLVYGTLTGQRCQEIHGRDPMTRYIIIMYIYTCTCVLPRVQFICCARNEEPKHTHTIKTFTMLTLFSSSHLHDGRQCILILITWRITLSTHTHSQKGMFPTCTCNMYKWTHMC